MCLADAAAEPTVVQVLAAALAGLACVVEGACDRALVPAVVAGADASGEAEVLAAWHVSVVAGADASGEAEVLAAWHVLL